MTAGSTVRAGRIWLHHCRHLSATNGEKHRLAAVNYLSLVADRYIDNFGVFCLAVSRPTLGSITMPDGEPADSKHPRGHNTRQWSSAAAGDKLHGVWYNVYGNRLTDNAACPLTKHTAQY